MSESEFDVVVVGAGFAGLYQLHRLRSLGFRVVLLEAGPGLGGIWHWNCYPGAHVDTHVPMYEFSDEAIWRDWYWQERFPDWQALRSYFEHVDSVWNLRPDIRFNARVTAATWDDDATRWTIEVGGGSSVATKTMVLCTGFASKPYVPDFPGLSEFGGECHHTARWPQGGLDLAGQRVGVVGVGASGVQVIQEAAAVADELVVFQRTPILALPMQQEKLTRGEQDIAKTSYAERFAYRATTAAGFDVDVCGDSALAVSHEERDATYDALWNAGGLRFWTGNYGDLLRDPVANRMAYDFWRQNVVSRIDDPATAAVLAPAEPPHPFGVKRPSLEQNYYDVFNQPNVELVDLRTTPIDRFTQTGIATTAAHHDLDVVVLATGFDAVTGGITQIDLVGTNGTMRDSWSEGVHTHLGIASRGFPNLVFVYGPQSPSGFCNGPTCAEVQGDVIVDVLEHWRDNDYARFEVTQEAEEEWGGIVANIGDATLFPQADSWYMGANVPGKPRQLLNFPGLHIYRDLCAQAVADDYRGFDFRDA